MPPAEVIALTDEIHARVEHREFVGLGPIAVEGGMFLPDAQVVAQILLADVDHWTGLDHWDHGSPHRWGYLAERASRSPVSFASPIPMGRACDYSRRAVVRDATGHGERLIGTSQDITERLQAKAAQAADRERQARLDGMIFGPAARRPDV
jgi:hypothetical protein